MLSISSTWTGKRFSHTISASSRAVLTKPQLLLQFFTGRLESSVDSSNHEGTQPADRDGFK